MRDDHDSPDRIISSTQVDEEIPGPISHGQQVLHALQIHGKQTGTTPYRRHAPRCNPDVGILASQSNHLPVQVVGSLRGDKRQTLVNLEPENFIWDKSVKRDQRYYELNKVWPSTKGTLWGKIHWIKWIRLFPNNRVRLHRISWNMCTWQPFLGQCICLVFPTFTKTAKLHII